MSNENLATLRDPVNLETQNLQLETPGEGMSFEAAEEVVATEFQREKNQVEELGKASEDPEAAVATQATLVELDGVRQKYSRQLDSVVNPGGHEATIRETAKVYDFQEEKTLREQRATLRASFKNKQEEDEEIDKAIEETMPESLRAQRLRKRTEHAVPVTIREEAPPTIVSDLPPTLPSSGAEENVLPLEPIKIETSPMAQSVRVSEEVKAYNETLKSAELDTTLREEHPPTIQEDAGPVLTAEDIIKEENIPEAKLELAVTPQELQKEKSEKVLRATQEGLKELSGDEWSDLYQQSEFAWTPDVWENLSSQASAGETSEREQLRQLSMNKAEIGLRLMANAAALHELSNLAQSSFESGEPGKTMSMQEQLQSLQEQVPDERLRNLLLEQRKLEQGLAQDKVKEKELFETARERAEAMEVDVSGLAEAPAEALVARINKPRSGYTDEELMRIAKESQPKKSPSKIGRSLGRVGGGIAYGAGALALAGLAKITWSLFSGEGAYKVLDWIDKGMEKIQKYAFKNDLNSIFDIAKNTGDAIHKKMDESIAKGEKKKEE